MISQLPQPLNYYPISLSDIKPDEHPDMIRWQYELHPDVKEWLFLHKDNKIFHAARIEHLTKSFAEITILEIYREFLSSGNLKSVTWNQWCGGGFEPTNNKFISAWFENFLKSFNDAICLDLEIAFLKNDKNKMAECANCINTYFYEIKNLDFTKEFPFKFAPAVETLQWKDYALRSICSLSILNLHLTAMIKIRLYLFQELYESSKNELENVILYWFKNQCEYLDDSFFKYEDMITHK